MTDILRPDGRPFVTDKRGAVPRYVVEDDEDGTVLVRNQFSGSYEIVGSRPYTEEDLRVAHALLLRNDYRAARPEVLRAWEASSE
jgi:hypothetical protein